jgi:multidrug resistance efflux pump
MSAVSTDPALAPGTRALLPPAASPEVPAEAPPRGYWPLPRKRVAMVVGIAALAVLALLAVLRAWELGPFDTPVQATDNAYVRGRTTIVSPQVSGYVVDVGVRDYADVAAGQALVRIDDRSYRAQVDQAQAALDGQLAARANLEQAHASRIASLHGQAAAIESAEAQQARARADLARVDDLVADGSVSLREQDQLRAALAQSLAQLSQSKAGHEVARQDVRTVEVNRDAVNAQIEAARAALRKAQIDLDYTVIRAPQAGQVGEVGVRLGQYVTNGTQLLPLVPADRWVIANFKEAQTARMKPGQRAWLTVDALDGRRIAGHVEEIAPAAGSEFSVIKPDNGTGNFVKIPQRIGVRIALDGPADALAALRPGMSVEAHVDTSHAP